MGNPTPATLQEIAGLPGKRLCRDGPPGAPSVAGNALRICRMEGGDSRYRLSR